MESLSYSAAIVAPDRSEHETAPLRRTPPGPASAQPGRKPDTTPTPIVVAGPFDEHFLRLLEILKPTEWAVYWSATGAEAMATLRRGDVPVVLCESKLPDGGWRGLIAEVESLVRPPRIVVTTVCANRRLWAEVLNLGAYDLLLKPYDADEVIHVVTCACQFWMAAQQERGRNAARATSA